MSHWTRFEADRAFTAASRARRRAAVLGRVRRPGRAMCDLPVYEEAIHRRCGPRSVTEIPLETIAGTTEPNRAAQFDQHFRPKPLTRGRWQSVWLAVQHDVTLPPISVVQIGDAYTIRDGHHRVSMAKARGALTNTALVGSSPSTATRRGRRLAHGWAPARSRSSPRRRTISVHFAYEAQDAPALACQRRCPVPLGHCPDTRLRKRRISTSVTR